MGRTRGQDIPVGLAQFQRINGLALPTGQISSALSIEPVVKGVGSRCDVSHSSLTASADLRRDIGSSGVDGHLIQHVGMTIRTDCGVELPFIRGEVLLTAHHSCHTLKRLRCAEYDIAIRFRLSRCSNGVIRVLDSPLLFQCHRATTIDELFLTLDAHVRPGVQQPLLLLGPSLRREHLAPGLTALRYRSHEASGKVRQG